MLSWNGFLCCTGTSVNIVSNPWNWCRYHKYTCSVRKSCPTTIGQSNALFHTPGSAFSPLLNVRGCWASAELEGNKTAVFCEEKKNDMCFCWVIPSGKLTWLAGKWTFWVDVFTIWKWDFPLLCLFTGVIMHRFDVSQLMLERVWSCFLFGWLFFVRNA